MSANIGLPVVGGLISHQTMARTNWNSTGQLVPLKGTSGALNFHTVANLLNSATGFKPRGGDNWINEINTGAAVLDHLDMREHYNGRVVNMDLPFRITAKEWNTSNSFLYQVVCPLWPTLEQEFGYVETEVYQIPYDEAEPALNVGRGTGYGRKMTSFTLKGFIRAQEADMMLLSDPNYGAQHLQMMKDSIDSHAELTFMLTIAQALVDLPINERLRLTGHPINAIAHARENLNEVAECFIGNKDPSQLLRLVSTMITDDMENPALIIPKGFGARLIKWEGEPKPALSYMPRYDVKQREVLIVAYSDGKMTLKTVPIGNNGGSVNVFEITPFRASIDDPENNSVQPLRGVVTLGEIIRDDAMLPTELLESGQTIGNSKRLDVYATNQTPTRITHGKLPYTKKLRNCVMLQHKGVPLDQLTDGLSPIWTQRLEERYNSDASITEAFRDAMRNHLDNDNAPNEYLVQDTPLSLGFRHRHFDGFMRYNDKTGKVEPVVYFADLEIKTLAPEEHYAVAQLVADVSGLNEATVTQITLLDAIEAASVAATAAAEAELDGVANAAVQAALVNVPDVRAAILAVIGNEIKKVQSNAAIIAAITANGLYRAAYTPLAAADRADADAMIRDAVTGAKNAFDVAITARVSATATNNLNTLLAETTGPFMKALNRFFPTSIMTATLNSNLPLAEKVAYLQELLNEAGWATGTGVTGAGTAAAAGGPIPGARFSTVNAALFAAPLGSPLAPHANEGLTAYKTRLSTDALTKAAEEGTLGAPDSMWLKMLNHVPDVSISAFLSVAHTALKQPLTQNDAEGLAELADMLESESRGAFVNHALDSIAREVVKSGKSLGDEIKARSQKGWLSPERIAQARAAMAPSTTLAEAVSSHLENAMNQQFLGHVATGRGAGVGGAGNLPGAATTAADFKTRAEGLHSWQTHQAFLNSIKNSRPQVICLLYVALLQSRFNLAALTALANIGIQIIQVAGVRMGIYQQTDAMVLTGTGPNTLRLAVGHGLVTSGVNSQQATFSMTARMMAGVLILRRRAIKIIVHAVATEHLGGRTLDPILTQEDLQVPNALDRRSVIFLPLPLSERTFAFPLSANREAPYAAPDQRTRLFKQKVSFVDCLEEFIGKDTWDRYGEMNAQNAVYYWQPIHLAMHLHDANRWLPNNLHPDVMSLIPVAGTGPLGSNLAWNEPNAVEAFAGLSAFPTEITERRAY